MHPFTETVEQAALAWFESLGYTVKFGPSIPPGEPEAERDDYSQVVLEGRLRQALKSLNPDVPAEAREESFSNLATLYHALVLKLISNELPVKNAKRFGEVMM